MLRTKSIHSPIEAEDGLRLLIARFRGRGMPKDRYDVWMANLGPSEELLRAYQRAVLGANRHRPRGNGKQPFPRGAVSWAEYTRRYRAEMRGESSRFDQRNQTIKNLGQKFTLRLLDHLSRQGDVTLLCHCDEDERHCHRHLLAKLIESSNR